MTVKNYTQLAELHAKYAEAGFKVLLFPCNQFGGQEPWAEPKIKEYVYKYSDQFDLFSKIDVNGSKAHPLWEFLKKNQGGTLGDFIKWNFTKFLVDKNGIPVKRFSPRDDPKSFEKDISSLL